MVQSRPHGVALLGLDVGKKTIGLALSDPGQTLATPLQTIRRTKFTEDMESLKAVIAEYDIGGFILGYPVNMDGSEGPRAQSTRDFAIEMEAFLSSRTPQAEGSHIAVGDPSSQAPRDDNSKLWIALWDERLSTVSVEEFVDKFVQKRKTKVNAKPSGLIDKLAAQVILQSALNFME
ncbi:MAG: Holliday junction resolvase RuvX [Rhodospirillales bacterium]|nr:Holliday junction resolvase RuvX [Alphaproteobacteria bacterium]MCB9981656.1 Holliday junction resolvase RuvX [Rhodospirillales bacterium]